MSDECFDYRDMLLSLYKEMYCNYWEAPTVSSFQHKIPLFLPTRENIVHEFSNSGTARQDLEFIRGKSEFWLYDIECFKLETIQISPYYIFVAIVIGILSGQADFVSYHLRNISTPGGIDELIKCAIDNEEYEIQVMLTDYKYKHNLFTEKKWEL